jgi:NADH-quinone oxidoreductase subunit L
MRKFGGLYRRMPITFVTFGLGYLALIGFPFLSGYYSKDAIIEAAFGQEGWRGWAFGLAAILGAGLTAFYMTRLMLMTFFGKERWKELKTADGHDFHPHESPPVMTVPMIILALGSVGAGAFLVLGHRLSNWLEPSLGGLQEAAHSALPPALIPWLTIAIAALGVLIAWLVVGRRETPVERPRNVSAVVRAARKDLYGNAVNEALVAQPGLWLTRFSVYFDSRGVDGAVNGLAAALGGGSGRLRRLQTGFVRSYALSMLAGSFVLVAALLLVRFS